MTIQILNGKQIPARQATEEETDKLTKIARIKNDLKKQYEELNELMLSLPQNEALVASIPEFNEDGHEFVLKTQIIGQPKGHFVQYKELDFTMNAKTTKKLIKEMNLD